ncbi:Fe(3+)-hydroxamate ABC transporter permease FhuB [Celerinatantimonas diazotrophica]|uniref:Iron complex transport system permease protein n=1 Tax=Celerinatantimonas diazotrophica TaxID=412034 RepID=A0A4R1J7Y8_9GAMM|nr:Fe(3+)-hydroxamate ABC transporter permease FhuB [Celerinatantimonas diazotrophica]TCK46673.1 iron complex transport system permease protein [Celerinatantimonas diazotrophica]CAG9295375.1 Iron(3+)-hydroxamate import system permease protein FhuB [Celerinatantimonas diazotrophica]
MIFRSFAYLALLLLSFWLHLQLSSALGFAQQWHLIWGATPHGFPEFQYLYASLPRAILALSIGATLGFCGSLLQQMTQNHLASPLTLGLSAGAWLALVVTGVWAPTILAAHGAWVAMGGALIASLFIWIIAAKQGLNGFSIILTGIAVNILCATLASAFILLHEQATLSLFIWGAGDLTQTDWHWVKWLVPKLIILPIIMLIAHRPLTLLKLGEQNARARGMSIGVTMLVIGFAILWLIGSAIAAVGVIGFISLLAPNLARYLGSRRSLDELIFSSLLGAILLLVTDSIAVLAGQYSDQVIPSGSTATLIGAPFLIILLRQQMKASDHTSLQLPKSLFTWSNRTALVLLALIGASVLFSLTYSPSYSLVSHHTLWQFHWPNQTLWHLRWPALLTATGSGIGMSVAGVILQRLIKNPLASPGMMGLTAGSTLVLVLYAMFFEQAITSVNPIIAYSGSLAALCILLLLGRKHHFAPGSLILTGIALTAAMDGVIQFFLAQGNDDVYSITRWMSGSIYNVTGTKSLWLIFCVTGFTAISFVFRDWLTLLAASDPLAQSLGVRPQRARLTLLILAALLVSSVTAFVGPIAFIGLIAPHMAVMLGAKKTAQQLWTAALLGTLLMLIADWLARTIAYPAQLPTGIIAAVIGSVYLVFLMIKSQSPH